MKNDIIQSAWGIVYFLDEDNCPRFLIIKRQAKTKKIERIAPKWKVKNSENLKQTALREVWEETWLPVNKLIVWQEVWVLELRQEKNGNDQNFEKDITFFLMKYIWDKDLVNLIVWEWFVWQYKRATIEDISHLIYFKNMRNIFFEAFNIIKNKTKNNSIKEDFLKKI